jgi:hypothetical protein
MIAQLALAVFLVMMLFFSWRLIMGHGRGSSAGRDPLRLTASQSRLIGLISLAASGVSFALLLDDPEPLTAVFGLLALAASFWFLRKSLEWAVRQEENGGGLSSLRAASFWLAVRREGEEVDPYLIILGASWALILAVYLFLRRSATDARATKRQILVVSLMPLILAITELARLIVEGTLVSIPVVIIGLCGSAALWVYSYTRAVRG